MHLYSSYLVRYFYCVNGIVVNLNESGNGKEFVTCIESQPQKPICFGNHSHSYWRPDSCSCCDCDFG